MFTKRLGMRVTQRVQLSEERGFLTHLSQLFCWCRSLQSESMLLNNTSFEQVPGARK